MQNNYSGPQPQNDVIPLLFCGWFSYVMEFGEQTSGPQTMDGIPLTHSLAPQIQLNIYLNIFVVTACIWRHTNIVVL
jgi:hypothetical protein